MAAVMGPRETGEAGLNFQFSACQFSSVPNNKSPKMTVVFWERPNNSPGVLEDIGINFAAGLPWRVMVTRDFSFCTMQITLRQVALNSVTVMSMDGL
jgi:hypothetical protein